MGTDYCASKFAARGFTEALRLELSTMEGVTGIRTSLICPGHIKTDLFKGFDMPLVPSMSPQYVASQVVKAVEFNRSHVNLPPLLVSLGYAINATCPTWLSDLANLPQMN